MMILWDGWMEKGLMFSSLSSHLVGSGGVWQFFVCFVAGMYCERRQNGLHIHGFGKLFSALGSGGFLVF